MLGMESIIDYEDFSWGLNELTHGSYSYVPLDATLNDSATFINPEFEGALVFAGEHTSIRYEATMHGAYLSGVRSANQILEHFFMRKDK
jgi:monoamine oxidase